MAKHSRIRTGNRKRWTKSDRRLHRHLSIEKLEERQLLASDLRGFDGRPGFPNDYFDVSQSSSNWGDIINVKFCVANFGDNTSRGNLYSIAFYVSSDADIDPATDTLIHEFVNQVSVPPASSLYPAFTADLQLPRTRPSGSDGTWYLGMWVDSRNVINEGSNESNNRNLGQSIDRDSLSINTLPVDLVGFDGRPSHPDDYFNVREDSVYWGEPQWMLEAIVFSFSLLGCYSAARRSNSSPFSMA